MKCSHPENKGNQCEFLKCPRGYYLIDFDELTNPENVYFEKQCCYRRKPSWEPKTT